MPLSASVTDSSEGTIMQGEEGPFQVKTHPTDPCEYSISSFPSTPVLTVYSVREIDLFSLQKFFGTWFCFVF
jgi:hypothetical protein